MTNQNMANTAVPPTEQMRNDIFNAKKEELDKELKKYQNYCLRSKDLEQLLTLHNFFLEESFENVEKIFKKYKNRIQESSDAQGNEILDDTFNLLFTKNALDFFNQFAVRVNVSVPENHMEDKTFYLIKEITLIYKGENTDEVILTPAHTEELLKSLMDSGVAFKDLDTAILTHPMMVDMLSSVILHTLSNPQIAFNTIFFDKDSKNPQYMNTYDFKKLITKDKWKKYVKELSDVLITTTLVQIPSPNDK